MLDSIADASVLIVQVFAVAGLAWGAALALFCSDREPADGDKPLMVLLLVLAAPGSAIASDTLERAVQLYREQQFSAALPHFKRAALSGNAQAQEALGFMYLQGAGINTNGIAADRRQALYWFGRAAENGREVAQHMLCTLGGKPELTVVSRGSCATLPTIAAAK